MLSASKATREPSVPAPRLLRTQWPPRLAPKHGESTAAYQPHSLTAPVPVFEDELHILQRREVHAGLFPDP